MIDVVHVLSFTALPSARLPWPLQHIEFAVG